MSSQQPSRREFFHPKTASRAIHDTPLERPVSAEPLVSATDDQQIVQQRAESYVFHVSRSAMACEFEVILNAGIESQYAESALEALDLVGRLESQLTVYRDNSEIMAINRRAFSASIPVEPRLFALLRKAIELYHFTDGAFDITAGPLSKVWGFHRREGKIPEPADLQAALMKVGSRWLELDETTSQIRFLREGIEINLGGIGKGYALDRCAEELTAMGLGNYLLHGGQSSILARGNRAGIEKQARQGWSIGLRHPIWQGKRLAEIFLHDRALGTSGTGRQGFFHQGRRYGHIIDPRNGIPADGVLSSTVLAPTAAEADALATAFYVLGPEPSLALCKKRPDISMIMVTSGLRQGTIEVHTANLADEEWCRLDD